MRVNEESSERQISKKRGSGIRQLANFHWPFPFTQTLLYLLSSLLSSLALSLLPGECASVLHNGRVVFGPGGDGSSRAGTEVSFLFFHPDQTASSLPKPTLLHLLLVPLSTSPLHTGCPHLSRRQLSIISVSQNPAGAHCARGRRWRQALGGSGGPQMESVLSIIVTNY